MACNWNFAAKTRVISILFLIGAALEETPAEAAFLNSCSLDGRASTDVLSPQMRKIDIVRPAVLPSIIQCRQ